MADGEEDTRGEPSKNRHREAVVVDLCTPEKTIKDEDNVERSPENTMADCEEDIRGESSNNTHREAEMVDGMGYNNFFDTRL